MRNVLRVVISGRVQGVGYRAWTVSRATHLGLQGWVRNLNSGEVEAVFAGEQDIIEQMIEACKSGPDAAQVEGIDIYTYKQEIEVGPFCAKQTV